jgi:hypothetical protein
MFVITFVSIVKTQEYCSSSTSSVKMDLSGSPGPSCFWFRTVPVLARYNKCAQFSKPILLPGIQADARTSRTRGLPFWHCRRFYLDLRLGLLFAGEVCSLYFFSKYLKIKILLVRLLKCVTMCHAGLTQYINWIQKERI